MLVPLDSGAWLDHEGAWLTRDAADEALAALRDELAWEQREIVLFGRRILQPRLIAWAGDLGYRYSGQTLEPRAFTPTVERLLTRVRARTGILFNHVLVNRYRNVVMAVWNAAPYVEEAVDSILGQTEWHKVRRTGQSRVALHEKAIIDSVRQSAERALARYVRGQDTEGYPTLRHRPILGLPLEDLRWTERRAYATPCTRGAPRSLRETDAWLCPCTVSRSSLCYHA
jgi:hypothetical protein